METTNLSATSIAIMLDTDSGSALCAAVRIEAGTVKATGSLYADAAAHIAALFAARDEDAIHLYLCEAQDRTTDPSTWKRVAASLWAGSRNAFSQLPDPLRMTATRDFRPTHRKNSPLFVVRLAADVKADAKTAAKVAAEKAAEIERRDAENKAAEKEAADRAVTPEMLANATWSEALRLGFTLEQIGQVIENMQHLHAEAAKAASVKVRPAAEAASVKVRPSTKAGTKVAA